MAYTYVRATSIGVEYATANVGIIKRHRLIIILSQSETPVHLLVKQVRKQRNVDIPYTTLAKDLIDLQSKGYIKIFQ